MTGTRPDFMQSKQALTTLGIYLRRLLCEDPAKNVQCAEPPQIRAITMARLCYLLRQTLRIPVSRKQPVL